jgi:hypothetical protein
MHTVIVVGAGLGLLGVCAIAGWLLGGSSGAALGALAFLPLWFAGAALNMYAGITRAGYSFADEAPVFFVVFAIPAAVAIASWWKLR